MKFLADENIPLRAVEKLRDSGIEITSIIEESPGLSDEGVLRLSAERETVLITFDKDFGSLVFKGREKSFGVILLRFPPKSPDFVFDMLKILFKSGIDFERKFTVMRKDKIRVVPLL